MRQIKMKKLWKICFFIFLYGLFFNPYHITKAAPQSVKVDFVGIEHSPLMEGDKENFYITAKGANKVQYRVFLHALSTNKTEELTQGYTAEMKARQPYKIGSKNPFKVGKYRLIVWAKEAHSSKNYDHQYIVYLNCVPRQDNQRVYTTGDLDIEKDTYTVGEKIVVKGIKNISGMERPYSYRLHIYDVDSGEWIIDDKDYRNNIEWVPTKPGTYVLDLWAMSSNSTLWQGLRSNPKARLYEAWKLKVITVKPSEQKVKISFVGVDHSPLVAGEREKFYLTSQNAKRVQYRAWIYSENTKTWEDITNGYSPVVDANKPYEIAPEKRFWVGKYKLWIWVREENSLKQYDNYYVAYLNCVDKNDIYRVYANGDMEIEKETYKVGEQIQIKGIKDISGMKGPYTYKLHIYDIERNKWILDEGVYRKEINWTPKEPGTYILDLWAMSSNSTLWAKIQNNPNAKAYEAWKLKTVYVMEEDEPKETENKVPYTVVNSFNELYLAMENKYDLVINNEKVKIAYEKAQEAVQAITHPTMSDLEKELAIHEYIVKNTVYDYDNYVKGTISDDSFTPYGALINGLAVCQGYAESMKLMLDMVGIENEIVVGYAGEPHAWNLVKIDGQYYHVDPTWNDPVGNERDKVRYKYFNLSDEDMAKDHTWTRKDYPVAVSDKYEYLQSMYHAVLGKPWIYYSEERDGYKLYKMYLDGRIKAKLNNFNSRYIATDEEWVYYSNYSHSGFLYKIRKDGLGNTQLNSEWSKDIEIQRDWIYYRRGTDNRLYKMQKDGTQKQAVE